MAIYNDDNGERTPGAFGDPAKLCDSTTMAYIKIPEGFTLIKTDALVRAIKRLESLQVTCSNVSDFLSLLKTIDELKTGFTGTLK